MLLPKHTEAIDIDEEIITVIGQTTLSNTIKQGNDTQNIQAKPNPKPKTGGEGRMEPKNKSDIESKMEMEEDLRLVKQEAIEMRNHIDLLRAINTKQSENHKEALEKLKSELENIHRQELEAVGEEYKRALTEIGKLQN